MVKQEDLDKWSKEYNNDIKTANKKITGVDKYYQRITD